MMETPEQLAVQEAGKGWAAFRARIEKAVLIAAVVLSTIGIVGTLVVLILLLLGR